jgi:hypothetical protein
MDWTPWDTAELLSADANIREISFNCVNRHLVRMDIGRQAGRGRREESTEKSRRVVVLVRVVLPTRPRSAGPFRSWGSVFFEVLLRSQRI